MFIEGGKWKKVFGTSSFDWRNVFFAILSRHKLSKAKTTIMTTIVQVAHITKIPGPVQFLANYITRKKGVDFYQIYHPLNQSSLPKSVFIHNKKIIGEINFRAHELVRHRFFSTEI